MRWRNCDDMFSRFDTIISERVGQTHRHTDRQTDRQTDRIVAINIVRQHTNARLKETRNSAVANRWCPACYNSPAGRIRTCAELLQCKFTYVQYTHAEHRRSVGWSAANSNATSCVIVKNSALMLSACTKWARTRTHAYVVFFRRAGLRLRKLVSNKKLSYRRETARRFLSWNILLSHSRSLKVIRNDTVE